MGKMENNVSIIVAELRLAHQNHVEKIIRSFLFRERTHRLNIRLFVRGDGPRLTEIDGFVFQRPIARNSYMVSIEDDIGVRRIFPDGWVCPLP